MSNASMCIHDVENITVKEPSNTFETHWQDVVIKMKDGTNLTISCFIDSHESVLMVEERA